MAGPVVKYSGSPSEIDTNARLTFNSARFKNGNLSDYCCVFRTKNCIPGYVKGSRPLNEDEWFHVKLNRIYTNSNWGVLFHIGLTYESDEKDPQWYFDSDVRKYWSATVTPTEYKHYYKVDNYFAQSKDISITKERPKIGDIFSVSRRNDRTVMFGYNGVDHKCSVSTTPDGLYPYVYMYKASEVELLS